MKSTLDQVKDRLLTCEIQVSSHYEMENEVLQFKYGNSIATVGTGFITKSSKDYPWATVYKFIVGNDEGDATRLLRALKESFEDSGFDFGFSFADTAIIKGLIYKLSIKERESGTGETYEL